MEGKDEPTLPEPLRSNIDVLIPRKGFWLALTSQNSKKHGYLKDGLGHSWPEYGSEGEQMVLFGDVEGGAAKIVPGDYFDGVYMCDSDDEE
jgi:hypothetical protein